MIRSYFGLKAFLFVLFLVIKKSDILKCTLFHLSCILFLFCYYYYYLFEEFSV